MPPPPKSARLAPSIPPTPVPDHVHHGIVPPYLLRRLTTLRSGSLADVARSARATLALDRSLRELRQGEPSPPARPTMVPDAPAGAPTGPQRTVGDAQGKEVTPGVIRRTEGAPAVGDDAVDEAYDGLGATYALFADVYGRDSIDGAGLPLNATAHYGNKYDNAFWDGSQMVFGDGDGEIFNRFTASVSVVGHELAHGVTQYSAGLVYSGQTGALNESVSDVFGALVEQYAAGQSAADASWLIGAGLFTPRVHGVALRSMTAPGTAYDDAVLGKDPQPDHMSRFVTTQSDNGGVHINSGIPNRAFAVASLEVGGNAWETIGQVWYDTLTNGSLTTRVRFAGFATATVKAARARYGNGSRPEHAVRTGWATVGLPVRGVSLPRKPKATAAD